jgi:hypothetical protein
MKKYQNNLLILLFGGILLILIFTIFSIFTKTIHESFTTNKYKITSEENKICLELLGNNVNFTEIAKDLTKRKLAIVEINKVNSLISKIRPYHSKSIRILKNGKKVKKKIKKTIKKIFKMGKFLKRMSKKRRRKYMKKMRRKARRKVRQGLKIVKKVTNIKIIKANLLNKINAVKNLKNVASSVIKIFQGKKALKFLAPLSITQRNLLMDKSKNIVLAIKKIDDERAERSILDAKHIMYRKLYHETQENYEKIYRINKNKELQLNTEYKAVGSENIKITQQRIGERYMVTRNLRTID